MAAVDRTPPEPAEQPVAGDAGAAAAAPLDPWADRAEVAAPVAARPIRSGAQVASPAPVLAMPAAVPASRVLRRTAEPARLGRAEPRDRAARRAEWEAASAEPGAAACARATPTVCSMSTPLAAVFVSPRRIPFRRQLRAAHSAARPRRACASRGTAAKGASPRARAVMCPEMAAVATSCAADSARLSERAATVLAARRP